MTYFSREAERIAREVLPKPSTIAAVIRAKQMIDDRFCDAIDIDAMAREAFLSRYHFVRLFRRCYGRTPHQYLTDRRIMEAKRLLKAGAGVGETCFRVGFSSVTSFSSLIKRGTGRSPSAWRRGGSK